MLPMLLLLRTRIIEEVTMLLGGALQPGTVWVGKREMLAATLSSILAPLMWSPRLTCSLASFVLSLSL